MTKKASAEQAKFVSAKLSALTRESFDKFYRELTGDTTDNARELDAAWKIVQEAQKAAINRRTPKK